MQGNQSILRYPTEPSRIDQETLNSILIWASQNDVSDIVFKTGDPVMVKRHGRRIRATSRALSSSEVGAVINAIYGDNGTSMISGGKDVDTGYSVKNGRDENYRFRFNGTGCLVNGSNGFSVTLRAIPSIPKSVEEIKFPMHLVEAMSKGYGMNFVTGETGSGKTTLQAAVLRHRVEQPDANLNVLTFEWPIEFMFDEVDKPSSIVQQTEVPKHLPSFEAGIRNAMRRDPDIILIGESRDAATMAASIEAARSGHLLMTTMHSNGVPSTIRRAVGMFPEGERNSRAIDIAESVNIILTQRLLRTLDGKRAPVLEYLVFDDQIREKLLTSPVDKWPAVARDLTKRYGVTMADDAKRLLDQGLIDQKEYRMIAVQEVQRDADSEAVIKSDTPSASLGGAFFDGLDNLGGL
ncbi:ATPase, T2SS/T4P/T4SS family [Methylotenera sp.]|uniref:type IV pilus twitching motility protein PilT n=1 Tax=Methylotenera sp. TaxID=2051956 RepID=UPI0025DFD2CA|nr:ATPase, T2SS/T4P/T4SS family [Methylotenera sp.]